MAQLINSSITLTILFLFYLLVLKKNTFFQWNRSFLLATMIMSAVIPWLQLDWQWETTVSNHSLSSPQIFYTGSDIITSKSAEASSFDWFSVIHWIYVAGVLVFALRLVIAHFHLYYLWLKSKKCRDRNSQIVFLDQSLPPFSFFNLIFLPSEYKNGKNGEAIIAHERIHQHQWHSLDRLLMEIYLVFFWFNPLAWLLKKELILVHEYLADENIVRSSNRHQYQQSLVRFWSEKSGLFIGNTFCVQLKKRIMMMNEQPSPNWQRIKYLLTLPIIAFLLFTCSNPDQMVINGPAKKVEGKILDIETNKPLAGVDIWISKTEKWGATDSEGNFELEVPEDTETVIFTNASYQDFETWADQELMKIFMSKEGSGTRSRRENRQPFVVIYNEEGNVSSLGNTKIKTNWKDEMKPGYTYQLYPYPDKPLFVLDTEPDLAANSREYFYSLVMDKDVKFSRFINNADELVPYVARYGEVAANGVVIAEGCAKERRVL